MRTRGASRRSALLTSHSTEADWQYFVIDIATFPGRREQDKAAVRSANLVARCAHDRPTRGASLAPLRNSQHGEISPKLRVREIPQAIAELLQHVVTISHEGMTRFFFFSALENSKKRPSKPSLPMPGAHCNRPRVRNC